MIEPVFPPDPDKPPPPPESIQIVYEGEGESVSADKLGKALSGLSGILSIAGSVEAKMTQAAKGNSFALQFDLVETQPGLFSSDAISDVTTVLFGDFGLIASIKEIEGREISSIDDDEEDKDYILLTIEPGRKIRLLRRIFDLLSDSSVTKALRDVCAPVDPSEGVDGVSIFSSVGSHKLTHNQLPYMSFSLPHTELRRQEDFDAEIISAHFMGPNNWRLKVAGMPRAISVSISDSTFMNQVDEGDRFAKGDRIVGRVEVVTSRKRTEYTLLEARHIPSPRQQEFKL